MLTISVTWVGSTFEAALDDGPEWPPHPARLFCALVAGAEGTTDDDALRWLERQPAPTVYASDATSSTLAAYVPINRVAAAATTATLPARTAGLRSWQRTHPRRPLIHVVWDTEPLAAHLKALERLARRVPYVGRSTSPAVVTVTPSVPADVEGLQRHVAAPNGTYRLRVPYAGYLDALRAAFDDDAPARSASRWEWYGPPLATSPPAEMVVGPWPDLLTLGFESGAGIDGRLVVRVAHAWKQAVLQRLGQRGEYQHSDAELALLHGHHDNTLVQSAFVALPFVGSRHATGQLLGVGIAVSADLPAPVRRSLLRLLGYDGDRPRIERLVVPGVTPPQGLTLQHPDGRRTLDPTYWTAAARAWVTAYPISFDRYPHADDDPARLVAECSSLAGFPEPEVELLADAAPAAAGAARLRRSDLRRRSAAANRPAVHARLHFARPVKGPVIVGHLRHLGLGLCVPDRTPGTGDE